MLRPSPYGEPHRQHNYDGDDDNDEMMEVITAMKATEKNVIVTSH